MQHIYFDNTASTPIDEKVRLAMLPYLNEYFGNPSSIHSHGRQVKVAIENSRKIIARLLNASPSEIFFTSGGTESDNLAIFSCIHTLKIKHAITSPVEHQAVLKPLSLLASRSELNLHFVKIEKDGSIDFEDLILILKKHPDSFVSLMHANNEIGNITDIEKAIYFTKENGGVFHSDTVQTVGHYSMDLQRLKADLITASAHKFHGPKGIGFLYVRSGTKINPMIYGGSQERNLRGGTENVYGIVGLAKALEICYDDMDTQRNFILNLKKRMIEKLRNELVDIRFNGLSDELEKSLYTVLNVSFPRNEQSDMLLYNLDINSISVSGGSACSSGSNTGSHVLEAIGTPSDRVSIRFSFSKLNTMDEVDLVVNKLKIILTKQGSTYPNYFCPPNEIQS